MFLKLSNYNFNEPIYINIDKVKSFAKSIMYDCTVITFDNDGVGYVKESPESILGMIKEYDDKHRNGYLKLGDSIPINTCV